MKKTKKLLSVFLALVIALGAFAGITVTAGAATESGAFLTVNSNSNLFTSTVGKYNEETKSVTVSYYLNSKKDLLNFQMVLNYDSSVLGVSSSQTAKVTFPAFGGAANCDVNFKLNNAIKLCGSDLSLWEGDDYSKPFVQITFDVKNTQAATTSLNLDVQYMTIAFAKDGMLDDTTTEDLVTKSVVDNQVVANNNVVAKSEVTKSTYTDDTNANLKVNAISNLFSTTSAEYDETTNQVTVSYYLTSNKNLLNFQLELAYDPQVLSVNKSQKVADCLQATGSANCQVNFGADRCVKICGSDLYMWPDADYSKPFVQVVFDVNDIKSCKNVVTDVYLDVQFLKLAKADKSTGLVDDDTIESAVYDSEVDSAVVKNNNLAANTKITPSSYHPVDPSGAYLKVNAKSNLFTEGKAEYIESTKQVVVSYYLTSKKNILNFQLKLDFDPQIFKVTPTYRVKDCFPAFGSAANCQVNLDKTNYIKLVGSDLFMWPYADYSKPFVQIVFDVNDISAIAPTSTDIYLDVQYMQIADVDPDTEMVDSDTQESLAVGSVIDSKVVKNNNVVAVTNITPSTYDPEASTEPSTACVHDYKVTSTVKPTCTEKGYSVYKCSKCGDTYNGDYKDKIPHQIKDSTKCSVCSKGVESDHSYKSNEVESWQITQTDANAIQLTFSDKTITESGKDFIYIYDKNNKLVGTYSGTQLAGKSVVVKGDVATIKLVTNDTVNMYGFDATITKGILGDVNLDGAISVDDATLLQKYISDVVTLNELQIVNADVNRTGKIEIDDATLIQKYIADIISGF